MKTEIYFDNASTTRISGEVLNAMMPVLTDNYGNSSSVHAVGRRANKYLDDARTIWRAGTHLCRETGP